MQNTNLTEGNAFKIDKNMMLDLLTLANLTFANDETLANLTLASDETLDDLTPTSDETAKAINNTDIKDEDIEVSEVIQAMYNQDLQGIFFSDSGESVGAPVLPESIQYRIMINGRSINLDIVAKDGETAVICSRFPNSGSAGTYIKLIRSKDINDDPFEELQYCAEQHIWSIKATTITSDKPTNDTPKGFTLYELSKPHGELTQNSLGASLKSAFDQNKLTDWISKQETEDKTSTGEDSNCNDKAIQELVLLYSDIDNYIQQAINSQAERLVGSIDNTLTGKIGQEADGSVETEDTRRAEWHIWQASTLNRKRDGRGGRNG